MVDTNGKYFFYVVLEETLLYGGELDVSQSAKES